MEPDVESTLKALERTRKKVLAIKPLAAGKLSPERSLFEYIYKYADSIAVELQRKKRWRKHTLLHLHVDKAQTKLTVLMIKNRVQGYVINKNISHPEWKRTLIYIK